MDLNQPFTPSGPEKFAPAVQSNSELTRGENQPRLAFTLIELLAVVAVIGVLSSLLLSGLNLAKTAATSLTCQNN
jgi:prepilin-type N-terminal cleavage/methylation domain-containing protein